MVIQPTQRLLKALPALYQDDPFLGQFLQAFEDILLGSEQKQGLEGAIASIPQYFDPHSAPVSPDRDFLTWLAGWTAFSLRADLNLEQQRDFIAKIIPLYRRRGTKENLQKLLTIFTQGEPTINDFSDAGFQLGVEGHSTIGGQNPTGAPDLTSGSIFLGNGPAHFFSIKIRLRKLDEAVRQRQLEIARALIDLEKPAHTSYDLQDDSPSMQIEISSTVGVDTLLGTIPKV
jgi:phage tail-like protein